MAEYGEIAQTYLNATSEDESLTVFERTWGHRLLMGISVCMLVLAVLIVAYCALALAGAFGLDDVETSSYIIAMAKAMYISGLAAAAAMIIPAVVGMFVAKKPRYALIAIAFAVLAIVLVFAFIFYACVLHSSTIFSICLYSTLLLIMPVIYLVAAIKVRKASASHDVTDGSEQGDAA